MTYRPDIDGLRAVAILCVLLNHFRLALPGGYVGVDVFFVISGYLITALMLKERNAGTFSLVEFWERRTRRLLPALVVVVAAAFLVGAVLLVPRTYASFGRSVTNLVIVQANVHFSRETGYFAAPAEEKPLLHTWSLAVEEQFYLFAPLIMWCAFRLRKSRSIAPLFVGLLIISLGVGAWRAALGNPRSYFLLSSRAWEILAGAVAVFVVERRPAISRAGRNLIGFVGLAGILIPCMTYGPDTPFPGVAALPPVLGAVLLIISGSGGRPVIARLLAQPWIVAIGLVSYSLYLWHWPLWVFYKQWRIATPAPLERWLLAVASVVLAALTYRFVETPFRHRRLLASRIPWAFAAVAVLAALYAGGQTLRSSDGFIERLPAAARLYADTSVNETRYQREVETSDVPQRLLRAGAENEQPSLFVWGDSHAMAVLSALDELGRNAGVSAEAAVHSTRPPLLKHPFAKGQNTIAENDAFGATVLSYIESSDVRAVLLAAFWSDYAREPDFSASLLQTVDALRAAGRDVYFMKNVPDFQVDIVSAQIRYAWHGGDMEELGLAPRHDDEASRFYAALVPALRDRGVVILDPVPPLSGGPTGKVRPGDALGSFYRDSTHLSLHGARRISSIFAPVIESLQTAHGDSLRLSSDRGKPPIAETARAASVRR